MLRWRFNRHDPVAVASGELLAAFGDQGQAGGVADHHLLAPAAHDSVLLPGRERPTDGVEGGSDHLRQILSRQGKVDLDSLGRTTSRLDDQTPKAGFWAAAAFAAEVTSLDFQKVA